MEQEKRLLALLKVAMPANTPLTFASEIRILEILGIVSKGELLNALELTVSLMPADAPATISGLIKILALVVKQHPKSNKAHHDLMDKTLANLSNQPDGNLSVGTFLNICDAILTNIIHHQSKRKA